MTTTAADGAALLRAILTDPTDDLPRLAYADYCDETGDTERAEFIRVQIKLSRMTYRPACDHRYKPPMSPPLPKPKCPGCRYDKELKSLRCHEDELFAKVSDRFCAELGSVWTFPDESCQIRCAQHKRHGFGCEFVVGRGFVESIHLSTVGLLCSGVARELFSHHPITSVTITDKHPLTDVNHQIWGWFDIKVRSNPASWDLPSTLFSRLLPDPKCIRLNDGTLIVSREYETEEDAIAGLRLACVRYGRDLASLPPLPGDSR